MRKKTSKMFAPFKQAVFGNQKARLLTFVLVFSVLGVAFLLYTRAASPTVSVEAENGARSGGAERFSDPSASGGAAVKFSRTNNVGTTKFQLFSPGWRGLGAINTTRTLDSVTSKFTEVFGHDADFDPSKINVSANAYKYTLGLYVLSQRVPCSIFPAGHEDASKCAANSSDPDWLDPSAFAKDANGKAVYPVAFRNNFLIVPDSSAWKTEILKLSADMLKYQNSSTLWDGLFTDSMGSPLGDLNSGTLSYPTYNDAQWLAAGKVALQIQKTYLSGVGKSLMLNGLATGERYFANTAPTSIFADAQLLHGVMAERIFREPNSSTTTFKSTASWLKDVEMVEDVERKGLKGYWWSKCWSNEKTVRACRDDADQGAVTKWRRYAIGSFLLAAGSKSYFNWDEDYNFRDTAEGNTGEAAAEYYTEYDRAIALGTASGGRSAVSGLTNIWKRDFSNGLVYVNPTGTNVTITLPTGSYKKFDATQAAVSGSVSLPAHTAEVFIKQ